MGLQTIFHWILIRKRKKNNNIHILSVSRKKKQLDNFFYDRHLLLCWYH